MNQPTSSAQSPISPVSGIWQVAYVTRNLEAAIRHWVEVFGAGPFFIADVFAAEGLTYRGQADDSRIKPAVGYCGSLMIELIQPLDDKPNLYNEILQTRGEGFHHVWPKFTDFDAELARLLSLGFEQVVSGDLPGVGRVAFVDTLASTGGFVELLEFEPFMYDLFDHMRDVHLSWDGREPIRPYPPLSAPANNG